MKISKYLTYEEATKSPTAVRLGIDNTPSEEQLLSMKYVATNIFDVVREFVGGPLAVTSFFRSPALNKAIAGSSASSQHMRGEAIDIDTDLFGNGSNIEIFHYIRDNLQFDQLILEYPDAVGNPSWVHVSLKREGAQRREVLVKLKDKYVPYWKYEVGMI